MMAAARQKKSTKVRNNGLVCQGETLGELNLLVLSHKVEAGLSLLLSFSLLHFYCLESFFLSVSWQKFQSRM